MEETDKQDEICRICFDKKKNYLIDACGHLVSCGPCLQDFDKCFICKKEGKYVYYKDYEGIIYT